MMFIKLEGHTEVASRLQGKENSKESKAALNNDKAKNSPKDITIPKKWAQNKTAWKYAR